MAVCGQSIVESRNVSGASISVPVTGTLVFPDTV